jgi:hypothetical protein
LSDVDGRVDLMGNYEGNLLLIQCKNYSSNNKVTKSNVRGFRRYIIEVLREHNRCAIEEAKNSRYK